MIKTIYTAIALAMLAFLSGCEVEIDAPGLENDNYMTLTALAVAGEKVSARISWTEDINKATSAPYADSYVMWRMLKFKDARRFPEDTVMFEQYYGRRVADNADVTIKAGGNEYKMRYNPETLDYECDYKAEPGDRITISAKASRMMHYPSGLGYLVPLEAGSTVRVPEHAAEVEIVSAEKVFRALEKYDELGATEQGLDSAMVFRLRFRSPSSGTNCFRLKVTSISYRFADIKYPQFPDHVSYISVFHTADPLLLDAAINKSFGPWPANITDVFSDKGFYGGEYVVEVSSRLKYPGDKINSGRYFEIEVQPISRELFEYLSVLYRLRVATDSYFTEPVTLPSNIEGGVGVFGAIGKSAKIRYWLPGEENPKVPPIE